MGETDAAFGLQDDFLPAGQAGLPKATEDDLGLAGAVDVGVVEAVDPSLEGDPDNLQRVMANLRVLGTKAVTRQFHASIGDA